MEIEHEGYIPTYVIEYKDGDEILVKAFNRFEAEKMGHNIHPEKAIDNCYILTIET